jgi:hypothetical protein
MRVFTIVCALCLALLVGVGCGEEGGGGGQGGSGNPSAELEELEREEEEELEPEEEAVECDPSYEGACLDPNASDYDCAGGSGDGPEYTGPVTVIGEDHYGLDSDGDGSACESS